MKYLVQPQFDHTVHIFGTLLKGQGEKITADFQSRYS